MDWEAFQQFQVVDLDRAAATVQTRMRAVGHMTRTGFQWEAFRDPDQARMECRRWLAWKAAGGPREAVALYAKVVNDVARFTAETDARFEAWRWKLPKARKRHPDPYSPAELNALAMYRARNAYTSVLRQALMAVVAETGLRRSEVAALHLVDVATNPPALHVRKPAKGGKVRWVNLPDGFFAKRGRFTSYLEARAEVRTTSTALWVSRGGVAQPAHRLYGHLFEVGRAVGFKVTFNRFRRTRGNVLSSHQVRLQHVQTEYGHNDPRSTMWYMDLGHVETRQAFVEANVPGYRRRRRAPLPAVFQS